MAINTLTTDPAEIRDVAEADSFLEHIAAYKIEYAPQSAGVGVLVLQNRQLGVIFKITTQDEAEREMNKERIAEWGVMFYSSDYFEKLKKMLSNDPLLSLSSR